MGNTNLLVLRSGVAEVALTRTEAARRTLLSDCRVVLTMLSLVAVRLPSRIVLLSVRTAIVVVPSLLVLRSVVLRVVVWRGGVGAVGGLRLLLWLVSILVVTLLRLVAKCIVVMRFLLLRCVLLHLLHSLHLWLAVATILIVPLVHLLLLRRALCQGWILDLLLVLQRRRWKTWRLLGCWKGLGEGAILSGDGLSGRRRQRSAWL